MVRLTDGKKHVILANRNGRAICFHENAVRTMGRTATGVRGMRLDNDGLDEVIGMVIVNYPGAIDVEPSLDLYDENEAEEIEIEEVEVNENETEIQEDVIELDPTQESIMVVSEKGFGKRSPIASYRITSRGGKGVKTLNLTDKTGPLVSIKSVTDENDLMIINRSGIALRLHVADLRIMGRATQGVRLINLEKKNDSIASVCKVAAENDQNNEIQDIESEVNE